MRRWWFSHSHGSLGTTLSSLFTITVNVVVIRFLILELLDQQLILWHHESVCCDLFCSGVSFLKALQVLKCDLKPALRSFHLSHYYHGPGCRVGQTLSPTFSSIFPGKKSCPKSMLSLDYGLKTQCGLSSRLLCIHISWENRTHSYCLCSLFHPIETFVLAKGGGACL